MQNVGIRYSTCITPFYLFTIFADWTPSVKVYTRKDLDFMGSCEIAKHGSVEILNCENC